MDRRKGERGTGEREGERWEREGETGQGEETFGRSSIQPVITRDLLLPRQVTCHSQVIYASSWTGSLIHTHAGAAFAAPFDAGRRLETSRTKV